MESQLQFHSKSPVKHIFSSRESWKGFVIEENLFPPTEAAQLPNDRHCLLFNWSAPSEFELKVGDEWKKVVCETGALICLSSPGNAPTIKWPQPFHAVGIFIDPAYVSEILGINNFEFTTLINTQETFLQDIAAKLIAAGNEEIFAEKVYADSLIVACITHLAKTYRNSKDEYFPKGKLNQSQLKLVIDFAYANMQLNIGLHEMAAVVHLSPYHFGRLFKQTIGLSPYQYVLSLKIECAKKMIRRKSGPISEIAYQLNFSDQSHFSNAFRKATGISPRQYLYSGAA